MIVVSGAGRGIGRAIADRFVSRGLEVVGLTRTAVKADFETVLVDVSSELSVKEAARQLRGRNVDGLVNAAGIAVMNLAVMTPASAMRRIIDTNLLGTIFMCQTLAPLMIRAGGGSIINFSTIAVHLALEGESGYIASKAGVEAFSRTLARELAGHRINVNCIAPGPIATDLLMGVSADQIEKIVGRQIIKRRFAVSDVCDVAEILLEPRSKSLSGQVFHIGGV
jgi:3-oxoacyl-[acyl-carrier protein] reductase